MKTTNCEAGGVTELNQKHFDLVFKQVYHQYPHKKCWDIFRVILVLVPDILCLYSTLLKFVHLGDEEASGYVTGDMTVTGFEPLDERTFGTKEAPGDVDVLVM